MKKSIIKNTFFCFLGILVLYSVLGFWILPKVLSSQIPPLAKEHLNRDLQIDDIQFNPFTMELDVKDFKVKKIGVSAFFHFQQLYINIAVLQSVSNLTLTIDEIRLNQPNLFVIRDKQGVFNFNDVLEVMASKDEETPEQPSTDPFPVHIVQMEIADGKLAWRDDFYANAQKEDIYPINFTINNFTTIPSKQSQLEIVLSSTSGSKLHWQGEIELFPFKSAGHIKLEKVSFRKIWELFLQDDAKFDISSGTGAVEGKYQLFDSASGMQLLVSNGQIDINNFLLTEKGNKDKLISIPNYNISGVSVDLLKKDVVISEVSAKDASFKTWLNADGSINYQSLFAADSEDNSVVEQSPSETKTEDDPWNVTVNKIAMIDFGVQFIDKTLQTPASLNLSSLNINLTDLTTKPNSKLPFELGVTINNSGRLNFQGQTVLDPFSTDVTIKADDIALKSFQPYVDQFARLDVISGLFNANLMLSIAQENEKPLDLKIEGDSHIANFVTQNKASHKDFVKWKKLSLAAINVDLAAQNYAIETVKIERPYSKILIRKDKSTNIDDIVIQAPKTQESTVNQEQVEEAKGPEPTFNISRFEIINGESDFADLSLILPFSTHIDQLNGTVKGISSDEKALIKIALAGSAHDLSQVNIKGNISPHKGNSEFKVDFKNMPLPLMTPYMAEFAGRKIEKGNMSLGFNYKIRNKQLTASNSILIDQLVLGDKVDHENAVDLPLDLAIALLENTEGKIVLDVPVEGSLEDPQVSVSSIIFDTLVNVITKAVSAPFNAIASLIDSDEEINLIIFSPGEASLNTKQQSKLESLSSALTQRTGLILEIKGAAYTKNDWPSLQMEALNKQLQQIHLDELNKDNEKKLSLEDISVSDDQYQELLANLFIQEFPQLGEKSLFGTPRLIEPLKGDFYEVAKTKLSVKIPADSERLRKLATARAKTIAKYLLDHKIPMDRVYLLNVEIDPKQSNDEIVSTLSLTVN